MANNTHVNKVVYNDSALIDLTGDTVTSESLLSGYTAHDRSGAPINGSAVIPTKISDLQDDVGYLVETDIVDNLTSTETQKPGSANMLKTLNDKLALQKTSVTLASGVTATLNVVAKQLNVVYLTLLCNKSQWAEDDLIATLPVGYRPTHIVHKFAMNYNMSSDNVQVSIGIDGQIKIWNKGVQAQGNIYIDALWFVGL